MPMELQAVTLQVAGSNPAGSTRYGSVAQRLEQVPIRTDRRRFIILVVMTSDHWKLHKDRRGECRTELQHSSGNPRGSTPRLAGALWHERDPGVSSTFVAAATSNRRMLAGLQVARPSQDGRSDVQIIPSPSGGVAQQKRSCRSRRRCGECLRDYRDRAPALREAGGRVFNPPLSGFSGKVAQYRLAILSPCSRGKTNECRTTLGLAVRIRPAASAELSCRDLSSSRPNGGCRPDYR